MIKTVFLRYELTCIFSFKFPSQGNKKKSKCKSYTKCLNIIYYSYITIVIKSWFDFATLRKEWKNTPFKCLQPVSLIPNFGQQRLDRAYEITLSVKGRKSCRDIPRPVWFVYEGNTLYLLPNHGSDTNWYKNVLVDPKLKISVNDVENPARGKLITHSNRIDDIVGKFNSKYGEVKKYYTKFDVAVEVQL